MDDASGKGRQPLEGNTLKPQNLIMAKRAMGKYKKLRGHQRRAGRWRDKQEKAQ